MVGAAGLLSGLRNYATRFGRDQMKDGTQRIISEVADFAEPPPGMFNGLLVDARGRCVGQGEGRGARCGWGSRCCRRA